MKKFIKRIFKKKPKPGAIEAKKSYAQEGEDMVLHSVFSDLGGRHNGFFIDVGALHPFRFSNTAFFYESGWSGINIEPTPDAIDLFNKHRTRDININCGVSDTEGKMNFYRFDEPALNSFSKELSEERHANSPFNIVDQISIPLLRLETILDQHLKPGQHIDFMSVDVEGLDFNVLKSNNWEKYRPDFLLVEEITGFEAVSTSEINAFLKDLGYAIITKMPRTTIYQHQSVA